MTETLNRVKNKVERAGNVMDPSVAVPHSSTRHVSFSTRMALSFWNKMISSFNSNRQNILNHTKKPENSLPPKNRQKFFHEILLLILSIFLLVEMARNGGGAGEAVPPLSSSSRARAGPDPFLVVCRCFSFVTALTAILCVAVNVLFAIRSFREGYDIFDGIFRCYAVVIALFVVVAETEWGFITKFWKVLEYWAGRGMLQIFAAVMTRAFPDYSARQKDLILLQNIASYMLLSCGVVYVVLGILCIGFLKRTRQQKEITRDQALKDLEQLERRREELEQLLVVERV